MGVFIAYGVVAGLVICLAFVGVLVLVQNFFASKSREGNSSSGLTFNPATGLLMVGVIDTGGSFYGQNNTQINPGTDLQMVNGFDALGNGFGCNFNNSSRGSSNSWD